MGSTTASVGRRHCAPRHEENARRDSVKPQLWRSLDWFVTARLLQAIGAGLRSECKTDSVARFQIRFPDPNLEYRTFIRAFVTVVACGFTLLVLAGCAGVATHRLADSVAASIQDQNDPTTVAEGTPAYLLMVDGMIASRPDDTALLVAGSRLYGTYAALFVTDPDRARRLARKALDYARRAICIDHEEFCGTDTPSFDRFSALLALIDDNDLPTLYAYGTAWAGWIQLQRTDWSSLADLPRVKAVMERVIDLDDSYDQGMPHVYLGVIDAQIPAALGGHPDEGRAQFEHAIELSGGHNLIAKVEYARSYARLVFDRELHDRLLNEVLAADPVAPGMTLGNVLAQEQARKLLAESAKYFEE
jgi:hypothetical protein